jgi:predicted ATPase
MQSETDKLRLFEAVAWLTLKHHALGAKAIVMDDMQFTDTGSLEMSNFLISKYAPTPTPDVLRSVNVYRTGEISVQMEMTIQNLVNAGTAVLIEVKPLSQSDVGELVESLAVPQFLDLTERLSKYTGGNPFFILETLKSLLESGSDDPSHFPVSSRVSALIHNRLNKLHPTSLKLARVAAVAGTDFSLQLAETILNMDALELTEPFAELERLQVLQGTMFAHDLIYEATLASIPAPIKTLLHGRIATWLEATNANPARIAQHYLDAGEAAKAAPQLLHAAEAARDSFRFNEAVKFYEKVATILESLGRSDEALKTWQASAKILIERIRGLDMKVDTDKLLRLAKSLDDKAFAWWIRGALLTIQSRFREAELALRSGIAELREGSDNRIASQLFAALSESLMSQGKLDEASQASLEAYERCRKLGPSEELIGALANVAVILDFQDRMSEAAKFYQRAEALAEQLGHTAWRVTILNDYGFSLREDGLSRASLEPLFQAREFLKELYGVPDDLCRNNAQIAESYHQLCEYQKALSYIEEAIHLSQHHSLNYGYIEVALARTLGTLGQLERAYELCQTILDRGGLRKTTQGVLHRVQAQLTYDSPARAFELIEKAINYLEPKAESTGFVKTQLIKLASLPLRKRLSIAKDLQYIVHKKSFYAYIGPAETRLAQTLLELGNPQEAEKHVLAALETLETYEALDFLPAETMFTYYRILKSLGNSNTRRQLEQTLTWLMEVADNKVPPEYRESFLTRNPVNKAILDEAKKVGISLPAL